MNQLGINFTNILAQIVNFLILFWVLKKFVFQNVINIIENYKKQLKETDEKTKKIDTQLNNLEKNKADTFAKTRKEAEVVLAEARKEANEEKKAILNKAQQEAEEIKGEALEEIKAKEEEMKEKVKTEAADLTVNLASELISKSLTLKDQQVLVKKALADFQKTSL